MLSRCRLPNFSEHFGYGIEESGVLGTLGLIEWYLPGTPIFSVLFPIVGGGVQTSTSIALVTGDLVRSNWSGRIPFQAGFSSLDLNSRHCLCLLSWASMATAWVGRLVMDPYTPKREDIPFLLEGGNKTFLDVFCGDVIYSDLGLGMELGIGLDGIGGVAFFSSFSRWEIGWALGFPLLLCISLREALPFVVFFFQGCYEAIHIFLLSRLLWGHTHTAPDLRFLLLSFSFPIGR